MNCSLFLPHFPLILLTVKIKKMKRIAFVTCLVIYVFSAQGQEALSEKDSFYSLSPVEVKALRAAEHAPVTKTNISKKEIEKQNLGQDLHVLLDQKHPAVMTYYEQNDISATYLSS